MGRWFGKISLRWKLASVTVLATTVALLMTGVIMAVYDARTYETQKAGAITSAAEILAASVGAALIFNDSEAALEYLTALDANPEIVAAAVYDAENDLMTSYVRSGSQDDAVPQTVGAMGSHFEGGELQVFVPVVLDGNPVGAVYLKALVEPVGTRLARYTLILLAIGAGALAIILPISLWLHRLISNPIEELAARNAIIRATLDSVDHGVVVVGRDMKVAFLNEKVVQLFKLSLPKITDGMDFQALMKDAHDNLGLRRRAGSWTLRGCAPRITPGIIMCFRTAGPSSTGSRRCLGAVSCAATQIFPRTAAGAPGASQSQSRRRRQSQVPVPRRHEP